MNGETGMLQKISGKFFKDVELYEHDGEAVLYSNYRWIEPIETSVFILKPVYIDVFAPISTYIVSYKNKIEKTEGPGAIIRVGDEEIIKQLRCLSIFGLKAFFDIDKNNVELFCSKVKRDISIEYLPSQYVSDYFGSREGTNDEIKGFIELVEKVIGLPRRDYLAVTRCLESFATSIQVLNKNIDLAYSMLVYSLESLSQTFDNYEPCWDDYYPEIKNSLDVHFSKLDIAVAKEMKSTLIKDRNFRLQDRFITFVSENVSDEYFTTEAAGIYHSLKKSELKQVIKNAYKMRSKFTHRLEEIQEQLKVKQIAEGEVFHWEHEPLLTYKGLARLTRHVIHSFITKNKILKKEEYNWREKLPGVSLFEKAPRYWIWKHEGFKPRHAKRQLSGFLSLFINDVIISDGALVRLDDLLETYEKLLPTANTSDKISMLVLYHLYNVKAGDEFRKPNYARIMDDNKTLFSNCHIEIMIAQLLLGEQWPWDVEECASCYETYSRSKYSKSALNLPHLLEMIIILQIANMYIRIENKDQYSKWAMRAILDFSGQKEIQDYIINDMSKYNEINWPVIIEKIKAIYKAK